MRRLSGPFTFLAAFALGYALVFLALVLTRDGSPVSALVPDAPAPLPTGPVADTAPKGPWPDVFGTAPPPAPDPVPPSAPPAPPPAPQSAPVSGNYLLKGLVAGSANSWAIVADAGGEYLVRVGDTLDDGSQVLRITNRGVWIKSDFGEELIEFTD